MRVRYSDYNAIKSKLKNEGTLTQSLLEKK